MSKRERIFFLTDFTRDKNFYESIKKDCTYIVVGEDVCPETGKLHYHAKVRFKNPKTLSAAKKYFGGRHVEPSNDENSSYVVKPEHNPNGPVLEYGQIKQGERTDLIKIKNEIINGKSVDELTIESPMVYHQFGRTLNKLEDIILRKQVRKAMTSGWWFYGETGTGKSMTAFKDFDPDEFYCWVDDKGWQDGYKGQPIVIIDEFRGFIPFHDLLAMIDWHPSYKVRRRNREPVNFVSKLVIITSALRPEEIYHNLALQGNDRLDQLYRRIRLFRFQLHSTEVLEEGNTGASSSMDLKSLDDLKKSFFNKKETKKCHSPEDIVDTEDEDAPPISENESLEEGKYSDLSEAESTTPSDVLSMSSSHTESDLSRWDRQWAH